MNQKNIFSLISLILLAQGVFFFLMGAKVAGEAFPGLDENGINAGAKLMQVISVTSIIVGLISYACREFPQVVWAYVLGFGLFLGLSLKHLLVDHINVPIPAIIIQALIFLSCGYLWMQQRKV